MAENNTLIVYASRHGETEKCAREIFNLIDGKVDICDLGNRISFPDASTYDTIIIGSSIHLGKVLEPVSNFCSANLELLTQKRIGLFITCPDTGEKAEKQLRQAFPAELLNGAVVSAYFDGTFDSFRLSILERMMIYRPGGGSGAQLSPSSWKKIKQFAKKMNPSHAEEE